MAIVKCTMLFSMVTNSSGEAQGNRQGGWSESVYFDGVESAARPAFEALCLSRARMLGLATAVIGQRYQKVDPVGRAQSGSRRFPGFSGNPNDIPQMALFFKMFSATGLNARQFTLRGLPDNYVFEGEYQPTPALTSNLRNYTNLLKNFCMRASRTDLAKAPITSIAADGTFILQQPLAFAANDYVWVSGVKIIGGSAPSGRRHIVTFTDNQHGKLSDWVGLAGIGGVMELDEIFYPAFEDTSVTGAKTPKVVVRKVGRPFGGYVGRASKRA